MALPVYLETSVIARFMKLHGRANKLHYFCDLSATQRKASLLAARSVRVQKYLQKKAMLLPSPFKMKLEIIL